MTDRSLQLETWQQFRAAQRELLLPAGTVAHLDLTLRCIDAGSPRLGTVLLVHGIPTWGFLYLVPRDNSASCRRRLPRAGTRLSRARVERSPRLFRPLVPRPGAGDGGVFEWRWGWSGCALSVTIRAEPWR